MAGGLQRPHGGGSEMRVGLHHRLEHSGGRATLLFFFFFLLSDSRNENGPSILGSTRVIKNMTQSQVKEIIV